MARGVINWSIYGRCDCCDRPVLRSSSSFPFCNYNCKQLFAKNKQAGIEMTKAYKSRLRRKRRRRVLRAEIRELRAKVEALKSDNPIKFKLLTEFKGASNCVECGVVLKNPRPNKRFCSASCRMRNMRKNPEFSHNPCPICHSKLKPDARRNKIYCSKRCQYQAHYMRRRVTAEPKREIEDGICLHCLKSFPRTRKDKKYCSAYCRVTRNKHERRQTESEA